MNAIHVEPRATIGNEHVVRAARAEKLFTSKVVDQHGACGLDGGARTESAEFGNPDREHALLGIDIIELQVERFGDAQTRDADQSQEAMKDPGPHDMLLAGRSARQGDGYVRRVEHQRVADQLNGT